MGLNTPLEHCLEHQKETLFLSALDEETVINPYRLLCVFGGCTRERRSIHTCLLPLMITLTHPVLIQCVITWSHKHSLRPTCYHKHIRVHIYTHTDAQHLLFGPSRALAGQMEHLLCVFRGSSDYMMLYWIMSVECR